MPPRVHGASTVEALIILPLVIWIALAALQLLWIFWAQHTLHNTGHYVLRAGQVAGGSTTSMTNVLATGMAATELQWFATDPDDNYQRQAALQATTKMLLHAHVAAQITRHSPTTEQTQHYAERRFSLPQHKWVQEIAVDHALGRTAALTVEAQQQWLAARQLDIEIWWCLPLQVPMVAPALQSWRQWVDDAAQRFCRSRELVLGKPLWPLVTRRKGPMLSGFQVDD